MSAILLALVALLLPQDPVAVSGVLIDAETKAPIVGARVLLARTDGRLADAVVMSTDDRGRFGFSKVPHGAYRLLAERDDYLRGRPSEPIAVEAGQSARTVTMTLVPAAVISGRVTDEFGQAAGKVYVRALTTRVVAEARTNDLGEYRLFGLAPGAYTISAERYAGPSIRGNSLVTPTPPCPDCPGEGAGGQPLASLLSRGAFIDPRALTGQVYPPVFFPGTTDRTTAGAVKVAAGGRVEGIDLRLVVR